MVTARMSSGWATLRASVAAALSPPTPAPSGHTDQTDAAEGSTGAVYSHQPISTATWNQRPTQVSDGLRSTPRHSAVLEVPVVHVAVVRPVYQTALAERP